MIKRPVWEQQSADSKTERSGTCGKTLQSLAKRRRARLPVGNNSATKLDTVAHTSCGTGPLLLLVCEAKAGQASLTLREHTCNRSFVDASSMSPDLRAFNFLEDVGEILCCKFGEHNS